MAAAAGPLLAPGPKPREVWLTVGLSVLLHGLLTGVVLIVPHFQIGHYITVPVTYTVNLVDAPPGEQAAGRSRPATAPPAAPPASAAPASRPVPPAPAVVPRSAPASPPPAEELTLPGRRPVQPAPRRPEASLRLPPARPAPSPPPGPIQMGQLVPETPLTPAAPAPTVASAGTEGSSAKTGGAELVKEGAGGGTALAYYLTLVDRKIQDFWVPIGAGKGSESVVSIQFRVLRSGQVQNVQLETSSGDASLDASAMRAIRQSIPLPPFPNLLTDPYLDLRYRFVMERG